MKLALLCLCAVVLGAPAQALLGDILSGAQKVPGKLLTLDDFSQIKFILYTPSSNASYPIDSVTDLLADPGFDASKPTVLYKHGFSETTESESVGTVAKAFLQRGAENFVLLDWSVYVTSPYAAAYLRVPAAGAAVGKAINSLVGAGLNKDTLWIIGHSLGGQLAGNTAKNLSFKPNRITGLDPAGPGFGLPVTSDLTRDDAVLVDIIHTDAGVFGFGLNDGTIDFWPNGGRRIQPYCNHADLPYSVLFCSHHMSWRYFAESVNNPTAFPAVNCNSWLAFESGLCPANDENVVYMGYASPAVGLNGTFYLTTSDVAPFGLGAAGLLPASSATTTTAAPSNEDAEGPADV